MKNFKTSPTPSNSIPTGIPYIVSNEAAERFSYYGMRAILVVYMTQYLMDSSGNSDVMTEQEAQGFFHLFVSFSYFMPIFGALLADAVWGKYKTIIVLSLVYCLGHFCLAIDDTRTGLLIGQCLIAIGAGGIKPCVSSHVGDQFGETNSHLLGKVFGWFYLSINFGAFISMLLMPWLLKQYGPSVAFAVPGLLMFLATLIFWSGRYRFVHIPPSGVNFIQTAVSSLGFSTFLRLGTVYFFIAMFWALFEQTGSSWVIQAQKMDKLILGIEVLPSQMQALNPLLILILTPFFSYVLYPFIERFMSLTALRKISIGLFITTIAFIFPAYIQTQLDQGIQPNIIWQFPAYFLLTSAEIMVSITCLEFSYTQAPNTMKSFIMALFYLSIALGNLFTSLVNFFISQQSNLLTGANYFWFFTLMMLIMALFFLIVVNKVKEKSYFHKEQNYQHDL